MPTIQNSMQDKKPTERKKPMGVFVAADTTKDE